MALRVLDQLMRGLGELRYEPTSKRVRALVNGATVVDSTRAVLVWEPKRIVPSYAVPIEDVNAELEPWTPGRDAGTAAAIAAPEAGTLEGVPVLGQGQFDMHTTDGQVLNLRTGPGALVAAAFRAADTELGGHVVLDFDAFDTWLEEEDPIVGHPRDPFHRVDVRRSSRHVRIEHDGHLLAESSDPRLVFETRLPVRFYLPRQDVHDDLLRPSATRSICAYKGEASYWALAVQRDVDIGWTYERPLSDAVDIRGMVAFFDERVDVILDGERRERAQTPWS